MFALIAQSSPTQPADGAVQTMADGAETAADNAESSWESLIAAMPNDAEGWGLLLGTLAAAIGAGILVHLIVFFVLRRIARRADDASTFKAAIAHVRWPALLGFVLLALKAAMPGISAQLEGAGALPVVGHALSIGVLVTITWFAVAVVESIEHEIHERFRMDVDDNLRQRKIQTQTRVLVRAVEIVIVITGAAAILMTFDGVRQFGASLLASAGLAGLVIGLAARPVVANLIAGVQIALTQPIRLDDVVIAQGEWGRIEEITSTYVVVKIWDERRLVIPLSKFIEEPFQNWTRTSAELMGTVYLYVDYGVPLEDLREELKRFVKTRDEWDKRVVSLIVTDATEKCVQIRALVSARNSGKLWDLRCAVREHLLTYVQEKHPGALPRLRAEVEQPSTPRAGSEGTDG